MISDTQITIFFFTDDFDDVPEFTIPGKLEISQTGSEEKDILEESALADSSSMAIEEVDMDGSD
jgi:hypothetical protein